MPQDIVTWARELFFVRQVVKTILRAILWAANHPRLVATTFYGVTFGSFVLLPLLGTQTIMYTHSTMALGPSGPPTYHSLDLQTLSAIWGILGVLLLATESERFRALIIRFCAYLEPKL